MSENKAHLICNAHLDPVWQWEWEEGVAAAVSTFRTAADLCDEFEEFIFCHNEACLYMWVEEYEPELFKRIQRLVKAGKWHIMGGWHIQPDCNMPSGESFVRQILIGKTYFKAKFGVEPTTAINFDPFGHTRGIAQILAKSGYDSYLFCRPDAASLKLESDQFVWVGFDGSEILATRSCFYNQPLGKAVEKAEKVIGDWSDRQFIPILWGVGNHGGGPSREDLTTLRDYIAGKKDPDVFHSTPEAYFADLAKIKNTLPRHANDLNPWAVGCYTSQVRIKQLHRRLENELYATEKMAASASAQGLMAYPADDLREAGRDLAFCEFHDILPGSSVQSVEDMSLRVLDHGLEFVSRLKARAFFALASGQPTAKEDEIPFLVYNPHPFPIQTVVECEFQLADAKFNEQWTAATVYQGSQQIPCQHEKEASNLPIDWRKRVAFLADLQPSCMNRFDCKLEVLPAKPRPAFEAVDGKFIFKGAQVEAVISTRTGLLDSYKIDGVEYIGANAFEPLIMMDSEDPWGMTVRGFREVVGRFELMSQDQGTRFSGILDDPIPSVRVIEDGQVRTVVEAVLWCGDSAICQQYLLPKVGTRLEVRTRVHWNEKSRMLKLSIPVPGEGNRYIGQLAYGVQELPSDGEEAVAQKWSAVVSDDKNTALTCINDGIYGSDFSEDGLRLTLLRSAGYCAHPWGDRRTLPQDRYMPRIDQGERLYRFWLDGGKVEDRLAKVDREALAQNEKPYSLSFFPSGLGTAPKQLATLSDDVVQMTAAKLAEDGGDLIIRLFEPTGIARKTVLSLPFCGLEKSIEMGPFEIKTLRVDVASRTVTETDLLERPI